MSKAIQIKIPKAFDGLFKKSRYKVYYGGRGGAKSYSIALALLIKGLSNKERILCTRELQASIGDSVHRLLSDIIQSTPLFYAHYNILKTTIKSKNGTEFLFKGLKHNITEIKGIEGITIVWCEESENISDHSWELLIPSIRKDGSEIWVAFNPKNPTDPTYKRFVAKKLPDTYVKKVSWRDNPYFPKVLFKEMEALRNEDEVAYRHIWEGEFDLRHSGLIFANLVDEAIKDARLCPVPYKSGLPVYTAWDLGRRDATVIWFWQIVGLQVRIIDYYANTGEDLVHYVEQIRSKPYKFGVHYLPHDAAHERLGAHGSIQKQLNSINFKTQVIKISSVASRIEAGRSLLKECYIDDEKCLDGIHALNNYHYEWDKNLQRFKDKPLHDWASDPADAFTYMAQAIDLSMNAQKSRRQIKPIPLATGSYMGA